MITIDGSGGEGGGQILRTSLTLSLVTGQPFRMERIRAKRQKPGLLRQHLTAVEAAKAVGCAEVEGAAMNSQVLEFRPGPVTPGNYRFRRCPESDVLPERAQDPWNIDRRNCKRGPGFGWVSVGSWYRLDTMLQS